MDLNDIKKAVESKYAGWPITWTTEDGKSRELNLRNMLRLSDSERETVRLLIQSINTSADSDDDVDPADIRDTMHKLLIHLSGQEKLVDEFMVEIENDLATMVYVVSTYVEETQAEKA